MAKKEYKIDSDENSDYMYNLIAKVVKEAGPRLPCSEGEKKAAELLKKELENCCESVEIETFNHYPELGVSRWPPRCVILVIISSLVFLLYPIQAIAFSALALGISIFGLLNVSFQYLGAEQWSPKIYPYKPKESRNVVGVVKPSGEVKKRVVFSGHIDSAHRFNLMQFTHEGYIYFLIGGIVSFFNFPIMQARQLIVSIVGASEAALALVFNWLAILIPIGIGVIFLILDLLSAKILNEKGREKIFWGAMSSLTTRTVILIAGIVIYQIITSVLLFNYIMINPTSWRTSIVVLLNYAPFLTALFFFVAKKGVPGALDNLSACVVAMAVAKILKDWKKDYPERVPKNTEVVVALLGSEESGCNGAEAFAKKHATDYNQIDTTCINMDTIADPETITIFKRESSVRIDFDPKIVNLLKACAEELKLNHKVENQPWVSGGTDASGLVKGGLRAASLVGLLFRHYLYYYHSERDDVPIINKERRPCTDYGNAWHNRNMRCAFENCLKLCLKYLEKKDNQ
ncbi:MAG TPA: M20/M25/M40 family metallo-hydrolase [Candidatus Deferrimicrobium sp.]|nr:M20/M25/M40 family metallo-hydrolase [Candidatus Deferrimicrobium sp.]